MYFPINLQCFRQMLGYAQDKSRACSKAVWHSLAQIRNSNHVPLKHHRGALLWSHSSRLIWLNPAIFRDPFSCLSLGASPACNSLFSVSQNIPHSWERTKPRYMTLLLYLGLFFLGDPISTVAKQFRVLMVFCRHLSYIGLTWANHLHIRVRVLYSILSFQGPWSACPQTKKNS